MRGLDSEQQLGQLYTALTLVVGNFANANLFETTARVGLANDHIESFLLGVREATRVDFLGSRAAVVVDAKDRVGVRVFVVHHSSFPLEDLFGIGLHTVLHLLVLDMVVPSEFAVVQRPLRVVVRLVQRLVERNATDGLLEEFMLRHGLGERIGRVDNERNGHG